MTVRGRRPVQFSTQVDLRVVAVCVGLIVTGLAAVLVSLTTGEYPLSVAEVLRTLFGNGESASDFIVWELRVPRVMLALLAGAALAVSGHIFQTLVRNPLASPDIMGVTGGAALVAVAVIVLGGNAVSVPIGALIGAASASAAISLLAWRRGVSPYRLVLVGIGLSAMMSAGTSYLLVRGDLSDVQRATVWLVGSLNGRTWEEAAPLAVSLAVLLPMAIVAGRFLDALSLGAEAATTLGVRVGRARLGLIGIGAALAAAAVAATGPIGFVSFIAPHIARRLTERTGAVVLPVAALSGAVLVIVADLFASRVLAPTQLPVGIVTSVLGAPFFMFMLYRAGKVVGT